MKNLAHQLTDNVKLLQKVALIYQGKVLLLKRHPDAKSRPGCWDLSGGNSEWPDETEKGHGQLRRDVIREVHEETILQLTEVNLPSENLIFADTFFDGSVFTIILGWRVPLEELSSEIQLSHEHTEFIWAKKDELDNYDFGGEKGAFVKEIVLHSF